MQYDMVKSRMVVVCFFVGLLQAPKVKLGDRITALQQIVAPFGKFYSQTNTPSVLLETIKYIDFLQEKVQLQAPKVKLGDRITALKQIVAPFGKTNTASVLLETIKYIEFLQEQVQLPTHSGIRGFENGIIKLVLFVFQEPTNL